MEDVIREERLQQQDVRRGASRGTGGAADGVACRLAGCWVTTDGCHPGGMRRGRSQIGIGGRILAAEESQERCGGLLLGCG